MQKSTMQQADENIKKSAIIRLAPENKPKELSLGFLEL